jgi:hypothetical protein
MPRLIRPAIGRCPHPLREQVPRLLCEAHFAIEILRYLIVVAGFEPQRPDSNLPTNALAEGHDGLSDLLSAIGLAHINLIQQSELAVKFEAETESEHKVSDHFLLQQHQIHAAQARIEQSFPQRRTRDLFIEAHLRGGIELSHQPDGFGQIAIGDQLEVGVHQIGMAILQVRATISVCDPVSTGN